jgi:hypothetical protein
MADTVDKQHAACDAILSRIAEVAPKSTPAMLLHLAEAYAYSVAPAQPHG